MHDRPPLKVLLFAAAVSVVSALAVSGAAVAFENRIAENRAIDRQNRVLAVAGLLEPGERLRRAEVRERFAASVETRVADLSAGTLSEPGHDVAQLLDQRRPAPPNDAGLLDLPTHTLVYVVSVEGRPDSLVVPVVGKGLWSTIEGFLALDARELRTVRGVEFYAHGETPGLGGEIDNPTWKAQWRGRTAFDELGAPALHVARRKVGPPDEYPYGVDAISGATITGLGVTDLLRFWLGPEGFGPVLESQREAGGVR
jgi:Na+-transporting NADH:ubiquinone oxidoreductase subunit C